MSVLRQNKYLNEIIEILDMHRAKFRSDDEARSHLSKDDNEWIDEELIRCFQPRYFISNYFFYRDEEQGFKGLYPFFDSQEILHEEFRKLEKKFGKVKAIVLKARQMGATTYNVAEFFHKTIFSFHTNAILVSQDEKGAKYNMGMYESAYDFLPWWMKPRFSVHQTGSLYTFDEPDENLRLTRPGLKTNVYADNANRPSGVGRGQTFRRALLDELAFWQNASQLSKALLRAFNANDGFYVMSSTANGRNDAFHNLWRKAECGDIDWNPIFIPFYRRPKTYSLPIDSSEDFALTKDEIDMRQRVLKEENFYISDGTFKWIRKTKQEFMATDGDDSMFDQEYTSVPEHSFQNSVITAVPKGVINRLSKRTINPLYVGEISFDSKVWKPVLHIKPPSVEPGKDIPLPKTEDRFHVWEKPIKGESYSVGVDVSLGQKGGDYSCIQVIKLPKGHQDDEQVACWHGYIDPYSLADVVVAVCIYYENALCAIEVNAMGMATFARVYREFEYDNVYIFKKMDRLKNFKTDIGGWWTNYNSKRGLISKMNKVILDDSIKIRDKYLIDELRDFTEDGAEGDGAHDDYVMAFMIALYCGHEGEFEQMRSKPSSVHANSNMFKVMDRNGVIMMETNDMESAERFCSKRIGSYIERESKATAKLDVGGKVIDVPSDFQNTAYSPIHDKDGSRRQMYDDGIPAEMIDYESVSAYEAQQDLISSSSDDAWKYE